jgi:hypothetical protein
MLALRFVSTPSWPRMTPCIFLDMRLPGTFQCYVQSTGRPHSSMMRADRNWHLLHCLPLPAPACNAAPRADPVWLVELLWLPGCTKKIVASWLFLGMHGPPTHRPPLLLRECCTRHHAERQPCNLSNHLIAPLLKSRLPCTLKSMPTSMLRPWLCIPCPLVCAPRVCCVAPARELVAHLGAPHSLHHTTGTLQQTSVST